MNKTKLTNEYPLSELSNIYSNSSSSINQSGTLKEGAEQLLGQKK